MMKKSMTNYNVWVFLIVTLTVYGCVSSKKYQAALDNISRMRADSTNQANEYADLQYNNIIQLADAKAEISSTKKRLDSLTAIAKERKLILDKISNQLHAALPAINNEKLDTYVDEEFLHISLPHRVLFNTGESKLTNDGRKVVEQITSTLSNIESDIMILGHADSVPFVSSSRDNWDLSFERAQSVMKVMIKGGISPVKLIIAGRGSQEPSLDNETQIGRLLNRRIELIVMPDMKVIESVIKELSGRYNDF